jgi:hypothetical protein
VNVSTVSRSAWAEYHREHAWFPERPATNTHYGTVIPTRWEKRIGLLEPAARDHWWTLDGRTSATILAAEVVASIRDYVVPALRERMV